MLHFQRLVRRKSDTMWFILMTRSKRTRSTKTQSITVTLLIFVHDVFFILNAIFECFKWEYRPFIKIRESTSNKQLLNSNGNYMVFKMYFLLAYFSITSSLYADIKSFCCPSKYIEAFKFWNLDLCWVLHVVPETKKQEIWFSK